MKQFHTDNGNDSSQTTTIDESDKLPTMKLMFSVDENITEVPLENADNELHFENEIREEITIEGDDENLPVVNDEAREILDVPSETRNNENTAKRTRLENVIGRITTNIDHSFTFNNALLISYETILNPIKV